MKKLFSAILALVCVSACFVIAGCGSVSSANAAYSYSAKSNGYLEPQIVSGSDDGTECEFLLEAGDDNCVLSFTKVAIDNRQELLEHTADDPILIYVMNDDGTYQTETANEIDLGTDKSVQLKIVVNTGTPADWEKVELKYSVAIDVSIVGERNGESVMTIKKKSN